MPLVETRELPEGRTHTTRLESGITIREHTRRFFARCDRFADGPLVVKWTEPPSGYDPIPQSGWPHPEDGFAICHDVNVVPIRGDPMHFHANLFYTTAPDPRSEPDPGRGHDPLSREPRYEWFEIRAAVPIYWDLDGNSIASSAGEPFDPPLEQEESRLGFRVERFREYTTLQAMGEHLYSVANKLNAEPFLGAPAETARIASARAQLIIEGGIPYWREAYEVHFREQTWNRSVLDQGVYRIYTVGMPGTPDEYENIVDANGQPIANPVKLDGNGQVLAPGEQAVYRNFRTYNTISFTGIPLP